MHVDSVNGESSGQPSEFFYQIEVTLTGIDFSFRPALKGMRSRNAKLDPQRISHGTNLANPFLQVSPTLFYVIGDLRVNFNHCLSELCLHSVNPTLLTEAQDLKRVRT
jgi:hypothetical protein